MFIKKYPSPGAVADRSKWRRWVGLCRGLCGRDARAPRKPSSTQKTGNIVYIMPGNQARRLMQASSITPPLRGSRRRGRSPQSNRRGPRLVIYRDNEHRSSGAVAGRSKWRRWAGLCRGLCGRDARAPRKPSSTQKTGNIVYIMPGNQARRLMQASSITPSLRGSRRDQGRARSRAGGGRTPRPVKEGL